MAMLTPSWAVLGDLGCKLGCLGRSWKQDGAQGSDQDARMNHQRLSDGKGQGGYMLNEPLWDPTFYNDSLLEIKILSS